MYYDLDLSLINLTYLLTPAVHIHCLLIYSTPAVHVHCFVIYSIPTYSTYSLFTNKQHHCSTYLLLSNIQYPCKIRSLAVHIICLLIKIYCCVFFLLNKCLTRLNETRDLVFKNLLPIIIELGESVFSVLDEYIVYSAVLPRITIHLLFKVKLWLG